MVELRITGFEGPLELLLQLIEKNQLDISELSLLQITDQYLASVEDLKDERGADTAEALADFIVIAARLMLLKSRALLPRESEEEEEYDEEDVGRELVQMLEEYRRYRDAVNVLRTIDSSGLRAFPTRSVAPTKSQPPQGLPDSVTLDLLSRIVREALDRADTEKPKREVALRRELVTVEQRVHDLRARLRPGAKLSFRQWIADAQTRVEVIVTFLAILELYKSRGIEMQQDENYGDILVELRPAPAPPAPTVPTTTPQASPGLSEPPANAPNA